MAADAETSFEVSSSDVSGAAAAVAEGSSISRATAQSATSTESGSAVNGGDERSRSPGARPRLPAMREDAVVAYGPEENGATQQDGGGGDRQRSTSSGGHRRSSRDAAGAPVVPPRLA